jgi:methylated-DNA-[protein]-cysteine S-methyltransferase
MARVMAKIREEITSHRWHTVMPSALGDLKLVRDESGLRGLYFPHHWYMPAAASLGPRIDAGFDEVTQQLAEYLDGTRRRFDLALAPIGDDVQRHVWDLVGQIPYGETVTYGELASRTGGLLTAQEVGAAVGRNPLCIVVACHRVVGSSGKLTGYAGGIGRKRQLLELERGQRSWPIIGPGYRESVTMGPHEN